jgi:zinc transporter ZupT
MKIAAALVLLAVGAALIALSVMHLKVRLGRAVSAPLYRADMDRRLIWASIGGPFGYGTCFVVFALVLLAH